MHGICQSDFMSRKAQAGHMRASPNPRTQNPNIPKPLIQDPRPCAQTLNPKPQNLKQRGWGWSCWFTGTCKGLVRTRTPPVQPVRGQHEGYEYQMDFVVEDVVWCACHKVTFAKLDWQGGKGAQKKKKPKLAQHPSWQSLSTLQYPQSKAVKSPSRGIFSA